MDQREACPDEATIDQFVFGRASPERASWVEDHAASCAGCRSLVATLIQLSATQPPSNLAPLRAESPVLDPGLEVGRYQVRERIGAGGMGVVLAAYDPELERPVAIKLMHPFLGETAERWLRVTREARLMARLSHPNVCAIYDVGLFAGQVYLVMELVAGRTLRRWLDDTARSWREIRDTWVAAGRGLAAAHALGIVHCDFKPDNVLVGDDGRIRVTDFGLARTLEDSRDRPGGGTPAYLAPELRAGEASSPGSDQYAFCVALRAALADRQAPSWLRRALARGLSEEPSRRHPSMEALIAALTVDQRRRVPLMVAAGLAVAAAAAVGLVVSLTSRSDPDPDQVCRATSRELDGVWDSARRDALAASFAASPAPFAGAVFKTVATRLDGWAGHWRDLRRETCLTNLRGRESSTLTDVRVLCLDERRAELRSVTELLAAPSDAVITRAVDMAYGLTPVDGCASPVLALGQPAPTDPALRARYQQLGSDLARVKTLDHAAQYAKARSLADTVVAGARALGPSRLLADALRLQSSAASSLGDIAPAEATLREAGRIAEASRADDLLVQIRLDQLWLVAGIRTQYQELDELRADGEAAITRAGHSELDEAKLLCIVGGIHLVAQFYERARPSLTQAAEIQERRLGDGPELAATLNALGNMELGLGHLDEAAARLSHALAIERRLYGDEHPLVAAVRGNLAEIAADRHQYAEAVEVYRQILPVFERSQGPNHPYVAEALGELAASLTALHRDDEAIAAAARALQIRQRIDDKPGRETARCWDDLGLMNLNAKRWKPAQAALSRAAAMWQVLGDTDSLGYGDTQAHIGDMWFGMHDYGRAIDGHRRARAIYARELGADNRRTLGVVSQLGNDELERGRTAAAIALLEQALAGQRGSDGKPATDIPGTDMADTAQLLARALDRRGGPGDLGRARGLAEAARTALVAAGHEGKDALADVERWLAEHDTHAAARRRPATGP